ncbi:GNAT family N-acetyltransferase [uncultured Arthrobacter sp.]|uniref:GNAT family N-acetyltransferase n=1 Tax=uncultured Arthrobacter sp. TaxID=114050 RepID=UPI0032166BC5
MIFFLKTKCPAKVVFLHRPTTNFPNAGMLGGCRHVLHLALGPSIGPEGQALPRDRQLFSIYVAAEFYGAGVGQALLDATAGDGPAMLWVAKENPRAVAFYRRNGFNFDGTGQTDPGAPMLVDARMVR